MHTMKKRAVNTIALKIVFVSIELSLIYIHILQGKWEINAEIC